MQMKCDMIKSKDHKILQLKALLTLFENQEALSRLIGVPKAAEKENHDKLAKEALQHRVKYNKL